MNTLFQIDGHSSNTITIEPMRCRLCTVGIESSTGMSINKYLSQDRKMREGFYIEWILDCYLECAFFNQVFNFHVCTVR